MKNKKKSVIVIYRPYKDLKNGKRIYAKSYGKKANRRRSTYNCFIPIFCG